MTREQYLKDNGWIKERKILGGFRWTHPKPDYFIYNIFFYNITLHVAWRIQMWKEDKPFSWRPIKTGRLM